VWRFTEVRCGSSHTGIDSPETTTADAERWATAVDVPAYAIDDETARRRSTAPSMSSRRVTGDCSPLRTVDAGLSLLSSHSR
jgi:hypothetical protein